jgi:hypothetical protein
MSSNRPITTEDTGCSCKNTQKLDTITPVILAMWEAEIVRITVQGQPTQNIHETPSELWQEGREGKRDNECYSETKKNWSWGMVPAEQRRANLAPDVRVANEMTCNYV